MADGVAAAPKVVAEVPAAAAAGVPATPSSSRSPIRRGVAVLLPLSGRYAALGAEVKSAIEMAALAGEVLPLFSFFDTAGDVEGAVAAARAARAAGFGYLLGPIGQRETAAVVETVAGEAVIGHLSPLGPSAVQAHVFRLATGPVEESQWVVAAAVDQQFPTMAIFYPSDETGQLAVSSWRSEADRQDAVEVVAAVPFAPVAASLREDLLTLLGMVPASNRELRRHLARYGKAGYKSFTPQPGFSFLYVPVGYELGALVAAYLPHYNVELHSPRTGDSFALRRKYRGEIPEVVQLVGPSSWASDAFVTRAGPAADGVLILAPCPGAHLPGSESDRIERLLQERLRRQPSELAMQAFDAATAFIAAMADVSRRTAELGAPGSAFWPAAGVPALARAFGAATVADGACGSLAISPHATIVRNPALLTVNDGVIELFPW